MKSDDINRYKLIEDNLDLVHWVIHRYYPTYAHDEDVFQNGCIGLVNAANAYDPGQGYTFSTLAVKCILNTIIKGFRTTKKEPSTISLETTRIHLDNCDLTLEDFLVGDEDVDYFDPTQFFNKLTDQEKRLVYLAMIGYKQVDIAKREGMTKSNVSRIFKNIRRKWNICFGEKE